MYFDKLYQQMPGTELEPWLESICQQVDDGLDEKIYGKLHEWKQVISSLPDVQAKRYSLDSEAISVFSEPELATRERQALEGELKKLMPWRKGPYHIHGVDIDTEWRSGLKWQRLEGQISSLQGRRVLDVGCGNGYHGWRMLGMGAELVIGIDPSPLFVMQFLAIKHYLGQQHNLFVLPLGIEKVPADLRAFDSVFSMGVFYHRRSPIDHLYQLKQCLKPGGELVLETLVIEGDENQVLIPQDRYAQMRNVWFIPSSRAVIKWLQRCGFVNVRLIDETFTSLEEQRATQWMQFHSLENFLDADDHSKTIEGYPAPLRAIFTAQIAE